MSSVRAGNAYLEVSYGTRSAGGKFLEIILCACVCVCDCLVRHAGILVADLALLFSKISVAYRPPELAD